jgi:hypothetical protein
MVAIVPYVKSFKSTLQSVGNQLMLLNNEVMIFKYWGHSKKQCFKFSKSVPHWQDRFDIILTLYRLRKGRWTSLFIPYLWFFYSFYY